MALVASTLLITGAALAPAQAAPPPLSTAASAEQDQPPAPPGLLGFLAGIDRSSELFEDLWGLRTKLSQHGITLAIEETSELLGNVSGGTRKGFNYDGLTQVQLQMDTQRAFGHHGGLLNISALNIHGSNLSSNNLQTLQTASGIEAQPSTRLWELWYQQKFLDEDRLDVKVGQQSLDQEFMVSTNALAFVNTMFGWPMLPSADLPGGGPAYPLSALGARISARPVNGVTLLAGVFNGSPVKHDNGGDPQLQNHRGTSFALGGGTLAIAELQFSYPRLGSMVEPGESTPLGWTYRIGAWYDSQNFADQRYGQDGLSLASAQSSGQALQHHGNYAWYAVGDQLLWRDEKDPNHTLAGFVRVMGTPLKDRNLIDFSLNAGLLLRSPFRYRTDDNFGIGVGYAHVSAQAAGLDADTVRFAGQGLPVRSSERFIEITYQYQLRPWIQLQPDLQYVFNPGGGIPDPSNPTQRLRNELVLGVRANIAF